MDPSKPAQVEPTKFDLLCDTTTSSMVILNNSLHEFLGLKDELLKHALPAQLLVQLTLVASKVFRSYSDLCTPVGELCRMVRQYSQPWEKDKSKLLQKLRGDYEGMRRQLSIALKKIEMMAAEEERIKHERRVMNWERLYAQVMRAKSHGRRWKFRIEPFKRRLEENSFNPYLSGSSDESETEEDDAKRLHSLLQDDSNELGGLGSESEGDDDERSRLSSGRRVSAEKRVRFASEDDGPSDVPPSPTSPSPPPVQTSESAAWTGEPHYDNYLLVQVFRPNGIMPKEELCCTLALGDQFYTSKTFSCKPIPSNLLRHFDFHFHLSDDSARTLRPYPQEPLNSLDVPKLSVAVYRRNITGDMVAHTTLPLKELTLTEASTILVPPEDNTEEQFEPNWEDIAANMESSPADYPLNLSSAAMTEGEEEEEEEEDIPLISLACHRVKVQRHQSIHSGTDPLPWDELMSDLGYRLVVDSQSRAVSAIHFEDDDPKQKEHEKEEEEEEEEEEKVSQEEMAKVTLQHAEELRKLQDQYEQRLQALSHSLTKIKVENSRQIEQLEQALIQAEQSKSKRTRSPTELRNLLARKMARRSLKVTHNLPEWGKDLPQDFFERLELFAEDSLQKQAELTERIKREVSDVCEKQLASQHKLAPGLRTDIDTTTEDVSLPALFMPTAITKNLVYTPRAHSYFHPPGSSDPRITQPPSVFKLPTLNHRHLPTLNLFDLSQSFPHTGPQWLRENHSQSPRYTPAPPPSACGFYVQDHR